MARQAGRVLQGRMPPTPEWPGGRAAGLWLLTTLGVPGLRLVLTLPGSPSLPTVTGSPPHDARVRWTALSGLRCPHGRKSVRARGGLRASVSPGSALRGPWEACGNHPGPPQLQEPGISLVCVSMGSPPCIRMYSRGCLRPGDKNPDLA